MFQRGLQLGPMMLRGYTSDCCWFSSLGFMKKSFNCCLVRVDDPQQLYFIIYSMKCGPFQIYSCFLSLASWPVSRVWLIVMKILTFLGGGERGLLFQKNLVVLIFNWQLVFFIFLCLLEKLYNSWNFILIYWWYPVTRYQIMSIQGGCASLKCPWILYFVLEFFGVLEVWNFSNIVLEMSLNYTWCVETWLNLMLNYLQGHQICCLFNYKRLLDCVRRHVPYLNMFCAMWKVLKRLTLVNELNDYL